MAGRTRLHRNVPTDEVIRLYRDEKWTAERIAKKFGVASTCTIFRWLDNAGVQRRIAARQAFEADPKLLKALYHRQKLTTKEIAKQFGVDDMTILRFFKRHNIAPRPKGRVRHR